MASLPASSISSSTLTILLVLSSFFPAPRSLAAPQRYHYDHDYLGPTIGLYLKTSTTTTTTSAPLVQPQGRAAYRMRPQSNGSVRLADVVQAPAPPPQQPPQFVRATTIYNAANSNKNVNNVSGGEQPTPQTGSNSPTTDQYVMEIANLAQKSVNSSAQGAAEAAAAAAAIVARAVQEAAEQTGMKISQQVVQELNKQQAHATQALANINNPAPETQAPAKMTNVQSGSKFVPVEVSVQRQQPQGQQQVDVAQPPSVEQLNPHRANVQQQNSPPNGVPSLEAVPQSATGLRRPGDREEPKPLLGFDSAVQAVGNVMKNAIESVIFNPLGR